MLECPVCYDELSAPVFQCSNGHVICKECLERLEQSRRRECPTCRVQMNQRIRCLVADQNHSSDSSGSSSRRSMPYERIAAPAKAKPLPKAAQASARRFSLAACPRHDSIMTIEVRRVSDEALLCFGAGGSTFQVQVEQQQIPAQFARFLKSREVFPKSINDLRDAGLQVFATVGKLVFYEISDTMFELSSVDLLQEMADDLTKPYALQHISRAQAQLFEAAPPHGKSWITMVVTCLPSLVVIHFEGDHRHYAQRMAAYSMHGVYDAETHEFVRGLSFDPSDFAATCRATMALEQVFRGVAMKATFRRPLPTLDAPAGVFLTRLRERRNLLFVD